MSRPPHPKRVQWRDADVAGNGSDVTETLDVVVPTPKDIHVHVWIHIWVITDPAVITSARVHIS